MLVAGSHADKEQAERGQRGQDEKPQVRRERSQYVAKVG